MSSTSLNRMGYHVPPPPPVLIPAVVLLFPRRGFSTISSPIKPYFSPPLRAPPLTVAVIRQYLRGYSGSRVNMPNRMFCKMLQK